MRRHLFTVLALSATLLLATNANAEEEKNWSGEGELGFSTTSGNSETETLSSKLGIDYKKNLWGNQFDVDAIRTESEVTDPDTGALRTEKTADRYVITNKLTHDINDDWYNFLNGRYEDDEFSSFEYQANATAGFGWRAVNNDFTTLDLEIGAGYKEDKIRSTGETEDGGVGRLFQSLSHELSDSAKLSQSLLAEGNSDNTYSELNAGLRVAINGALALKLSHTVKHNSNVTPGTSEYDRITGVNLVYGF
ncbi:MAG: DUF481 domain-containing protein [Pseudomonadota bacterium]